ncbi:alpha/beta fold hydrolase [Neobacillus sp. NPDC058068]|uniref:S9 family peptidase n=1 Tax=Neobacillus sp. NPDC058068 TaxID=3346325 RepID=UPI0036D9C6DF
MSLQTNFLLDYLTVNTAYESQTIPNKNQVTFLSKKTGIPQLWTWTETSGQIKQVMDFPDRVVSVHHSPTGKYTIVGMDHKGNEKQQLYLVKDALNQVEELVISPDYFHLFGAWSPDERKIAWSSNRRHPGYFDIYVQNLETKEYEVVYEYNGNCTPIKWLYNSTKLLISVQETNIDNALYLLDIETKKLQRIGSQDKTGRFHSVQLTKDGAGGFLLSDVNDNTKALYSFTFENNEMKKVLHIPKWDIDEMKLSPDEQKLVYTVNEGGISSIHILDLKSNKSMQVKDILNGKLDSLSWLNDDEFIFTLKSPIQPGDIWRYTLSANTVVRITYFSKSEKIEAQLIEPELHSFTSFDGLEVPYFYYAKEKKKQPAMIYVHGGPESQISAEYHPTIQYLASQGFAVIAPNIRGSMGYGRNYVKLDDVRKRMDAIADIASLVRHLTEHNLIDPEKVGIMGRSYGGFVVLAAITHYPDLWSAAVDIVGISHFKTFLENTGPWRRKLRECEYGSLEHDTEFFEEIAPLNLTDRIKTPLLVFHGKNDTRVPISEAEQLVNNLKSRGNEVEFIIFEDEGHFTEKLENHITLNSTTVEFMKKHLTY